MFIHFKRLLVGMIIFIIGTSALTACDATEPVTFGRFRLQVEEYDFPLYKVQPICYVLEKAGYIMPYGPPLSWYTFNITQSQIVLYLNNDRLITLFKEIPNLYVLVNWTIPADMSRLPDAVSQKTVDALAEDAKKICRIIQAEAQKQGIGSVAVQISLRDLVRGLETEYGAGAQLAPTSDCNSLIGLYVGKSIGLNPQGRTPGRCPSLYVPN